jgi:putative lipoic acid-binding regulatory protein
MQNLEGEAYVFPGAFEVAAMGAADIGLADALPGLVEAAGAQVLTGSLRVRESSGGNYVSVSISFLAADRAQLDAVHEAVRTFPGVRWLL